MQNQRLVEHATRTTAPHLLISYERTIAGGEGVRQDLIECLIRFLQPALITPERNRALRVFDNRQRGVSRAVDNSAPASVSN